MRTIVKVGKACFVLPKGVVMTPETLAETVALNPPYYPNKQYTVDEDAEICVLFVPDDRISFPRLVKPEAPPKPEEPDQPEEVKF